MSRRQVRFNNALIALCLLLILLAVLGSLLDGGAR